MGSEPTDRNSRCPSARAVQDRAGADSFGMLPPAQGAVKPEYRRAVRQPREETLRPAAVRCGPGAVSPDGLRSYLFQVRMSISMVLVPPTLP